ncbi:hypothetical protein [Intrasporangium sp. DVR]|uniref:hypothetical protein n=1 Tax=Intrasporangium sp. DVR TaxID=3127867 RepID=UPI00334249BE
MPTPVAAVVAIDGCNLLVAAGSAVWVISGGTSRQAWTIPSGYDTAAIAYAGGSLWWAGVGEAGTRLLSVNSAGGTTSEVALPDSTTEIVALHVWGDRIVVGMTGRHGHSVVAAVKGARLEPLLERAGRITGLAADPTSIAAVFATPHQSTVVWGRPNALHEHTWRGPANIVDVAVNGQDIAFGLTRLDSEQIPQGSEVLLSSIQGRHWSDLHLGRAELTAIAFVTSELWLSKSGTSGGISVYAAAADGSLRHVPAAGASELPIFLLPTPDGTWVVGSDAFVLDTH